MKSAQGKRPVSQQRQQSAFAGTRPSTSVRTDRHLSKITQAFNFNRASNIVVTKPFLNNQFQSSFQERNWLKKHGKEHRIHFKDEQIQKLRQYFSSLDGDGSGSIGLDELEDPLIALGLAQTREEVEKLIEEVDEDKSGQIEFKEFLSIMSSVKKGGNEVSKHKNPIYDFFKRMSDGDLGDDMDNDVPFKLNVSRFRRRKIMDAITEVDNKVKRDQGQKIMLAFKRQLMIYKQQERLAKGEDPNDNSLDVIPNKENGVNPRNGFPRLVRIIQPDPRLQKHNTKGSEK